MFSYSKRFFCKVVLVVLPWAFWEASSSNESFLESHPEEKTFHLWNSLAEEIQIFILAQGVDLNVFRQVSRASYARASYTQVRRVEAYQRNHQARADLQDSLEGEDQQLLRRWEQEAQQRGQSPLSPEPSVVTSSQPQPHISQDLPSDFSTLALLYGHLVKALESCQILGEGSQGRIQRTSFQLGQETPLSMTCENALKHLFLRDKYGASLEKNIKGNHTTTPLGDIFIKVDDYFFDNLINPLDFMMEKAVFLLSHSLFPEQDLMAPSHIGIFHNLCEVRLGGDRKPITGGRIPALIQIAQKRTGRPLDEVLQDIPVRSEYHAWFREQISSSSYSAFILLSFLISPADYKADNIFLETGGHLVGIDNDMAFADTVVQYFQGSHMGVKNMLYALPLMDDPLDAEILDKIARWDPAVMVTCWLQDLSWYNEQYSLLFKGPLEQEYTQVPVWLSSSDFPQRFPLALRPGTAAQLYQTLNLIKERTSQGRTSVTPHEVLQQIDPIQACYYQWLREVYKTTLTTQGPKEAYKRLGKEYKAQTGTLLEDIPSLQWPRGDSVKHSESYLRERTQPLSEALRELLGQCSFTELLRSRSLSSSVLHWVLETLKPKISVFQDPQSNPLRILLQSAPHGTLSRTRKILGVFLNYYQNSSDASSYNHLLNHQDKYDRTPLDSALEAGLSGFVEKLVQKGAYALHPTSLQKACDLIKDPRDPLSTSCLKILLDRHPQEHWQITLKEVMPEEFRKQVTLKSLEPFQTYGLTTDQLRALVSEKKEHRRDNKFGKRAVSWLKSGPVLEGDIKDKILRPGEQAVYLKWGPEFPLVEMGAGKLMRLIMGEGAPYSTLMALESKEFTCPVLVSQSVPGLTLYEVLSENRQNIFHNIDPLSLSQALVMTMILNPEDGNPTNYMVEPIPGISQYRLVCIDNERILVPPVAQVIHAHKSKTSLQVRTILYCLEAMAQPVHAEVVRRIKELDVLATLQSWLEELKGLHKEALHLFKSDELNRWAKQKESIIGIPFVEGAMGQLYTRLMSIQTALLREETLTHSELLHHVDPFLRTRYQGAFRAVPFRSQEDLQVILERWGSVDGEGYQTATGQPWQAKGRIAPISTSQFSHLLPSLKLPAKEELQKKLGQNQLGPIQALQELATMADLHQDVGTILGQIQAYKGRWAFQDYFSFKEQGHLSVQSREQALQRIFGEVRSGKLQLSRLQEQALFEGLVRGAELRHLIFLQSLTLGNHSLKQINLRYLTLVDISGAYEIDHTFIEQLIRGATHLKELYMNELNKIFSHLKIENPKSFLSCLQVQKIPGLTRVTLTLPYLKTCDLNRNPGLTKLDLVTPGLTILNIKGSPGIDPERLVRIIRPGLLISGLETYLSTDINKLMGNLNTNVLRLDLSHKRIDSFTLTYLRSHKNLGFMTTVNISGTEIDHTFIYQLIKGSVHLKELYMNDLRKVITHLKIESLESSLTCLQVQGIQGLTRVTLTLPHLRSCDLNRNPGLTKLDLVTPELNILNIKKSLGIGLESLIRIMKSEILINGLEAYLSVDINKLKGNLNTNVSRLDLSHKRIDSLTLMYLCLHKSLRFMTELDLEYKNIGTAEVEELRMLMNLTDLNLSGNTIGDVGAEGLRMLTNLRWLNLSGNTIGDVGAEGLRMLTNLRWLNLSGNKIDIARAAGLKILTNLIELNLSRNKVGSAEGLSTLTNLRCLDLSGNTIGDVRAEGLRMLTNLTELNLSGNNIYSAGAEGLSTLTNLTQLYLSGNKIGSAGAEGLRMLTNLTDLNLWSNNIRDAGAEGLSTLTNLTQLYLSGNAIGDAGAGKLRMLTNLTQLYLSGNTIGDAGAGKLRMLTNLTELNLSGNKIGSAGAKELSTLTNLTELNLSGNKIDSAGAKELSTLTNLTELNLSGNKIDSAGAKELSTLTNLTELNLSGKIENTVGAAAQQNLKKALPHCDIRF